MIMYWKSHNMWTIISSRWFIVTLMNSWNNNLPSNKYPDCYFSQSQVTVVIATWSTMMEQQQDLGGLSPTSATEELAVFAKSLTVKRRVHIKGERYASSDTKTSQVDLSTVLKWVIGELIWQLFHMFVFLIFFSIYLKLVDVSCLSHPIRSIIVKSSRLQL